MGLNSSVQRSLLLKVTRQPGWRLRLLNLKAVKPPLLILVQNRSDRVNEPIGAWQSTVEKVVMVTLLSRCCAEAVAARVAITGMICKLSALIDP
jgi:hypothetical protein